MRHQIEPEIGRQELLVEQSFEEKKSNNDRLATMIEAGFQKLSHTIEVLLSSQNSLAEALRI